jgi:hypothetical protein
MSDCVLCECGHECRAHPNVGRLASWPTRCLYCECLDFKPREAADEPHLGPCRAGSNGVAFRSAPLPVRQGTRRMSDRSIGSDDDPRWHDFVLGTGLYNHGPDTPCTHPGCDRIIKSGAPWCNHDEVAGRSPSGKERGG